MDTAASPQTGILASLRSLGDSLLGSVQDRLKLFSVELQEEKFRLTQTLIWIGMAFFTSLMAATFISLTLVFLFWETARLAVLGGLSLFYIAAAVTVVLGFRRFLARQPSPFEATLEELGKDRACIQA